MLEVIKICFISNPKLIINDTVTVDLKYFLTFIYFLFYVAFISQGHIKMGSLRVEEPVHTSWSRF